MPMYCPTELTCLPGMVNAPDSNMEAKLHMTSEIRLKANGRLPGLARRHNTAPAENNARTAATA